MPCKGVKAGGLCRFFQGTLISISVAQSYTCTGVYMDTALYGTAWRLELHFERQFMTICSCTFCSSIGKTGFTKTTGQERAKRIDSPTGHCFCFKKRRHALCSQSSKRGSEEATVPEKKHIIHMRPHIHSVYKITALLYGQPELRLRHVLAISGG